MSYLVFKSAVAQQYIYKPPSWISKRTHLAEYMLNSCEKLLLLLLQVKGMEIIKWLEVELCHDQAEISNDRAKIDKLSSHIPFNAPFQLH